VCGAYLSTSDVLSRARQIFGESPYATWFHSVLELACQVYDDHGPTLDLAAWEEVRRGPEFGEDEGEYVETES